MQMAAFYPAYSPTALLAPDTRDSIDSAHAVSSCVSSSAADWSWHNPTFDWDAISSGQATPTEAVTGTKPDFCTSSTLRSASLLVQAARADKLHLLWAEQEKDGVEDVPRSVFSVPQCDLSRAASTPSEECLVPSMVAMWEQQAKLPLPLLMARCTAGSSSASAPASSSVDSEESDDVPLTAIACDGARASCDISGPRAVDTPPRPHSPQRRLPHHSQDAVTPLKQALPESLSLLDTVAPLDTTQLYLPSSSPVKQPPQGADLDSGPQPHPLLQCPTAATTAVAEENCKEALLAFPLLDLLPELEDDDDDDNMMVNPGVESPRALAVVPGPAAHASLQVASWLVMAVVSALPLMRP